jgi:hypothetical protein
VIPAGYYTVSMFGSVREHSYFTLMGPGENIVENMDGGEMSTYQMNASRPTDLRLAQHGHERRLRSRHRQHVGSSPVVGPKGLTARPTAPRSRRTCSGATR